MPIREALNTRLQLGFSPEGVEVTASALEQGPGQVWALDGPGPALRGGLGACRH